MIPCLIPVGRGTKGRPENQFPPLPPKGREVAVAVTMGCGDECPLVEAQRREEWQIPDPKVMPPEQYHEVRDLIERKVRELLATL